MPNKKAAAKKAPAKKNPSAPTAKTIRKQLRSSGSKRRKLTTRKRITKYGMRNFVRNAWLSAAATAVMIVTLMIIFATVIISQLLNNTIATMNERVSDISIFFSHDVSDDTLRVLAGKMRLTENVISDSVTVENSATVFDSFIEDNKDNPDAINMITLIQESGVDPRTSFPARMTLQVEDPNNLDPVKQLVNEDTVFQRWLSTDPSHQPSYENAITRNTIDAIINWSNLARNIGLAAAGIFLVISILVIFNTIRMAIFSRREEIDIMKSIGADRHFIRGPFLIEAQMYGFFAAVIATGLGYLAFSRFVPGLQQYGIYVENIELIMYNWWPVILGGMIFLGMLIGYASSYLAVKKHLK